MTNSHPSEPSQSPWITRREAVSYLLWLAFAVAQYRGCENARRLERIEEQNRELRAMMEQGRK